MVDDRDEIPPDFDLQEYYAVECPVCDLDLIFQPSMAMESGQNRGGAVCLGCDAKLGLFIDVENNEGVACAMPTCRDVMQ